MYYFVGQKVSHQRFGDGEVIEIDKKSKYPVFCKFKMATHSFTLDGKFSLSDEFPSLSQQSHIPLELKEMITFEKGELVWVRYGCGEWTARYHCYKDNNDYWCFDSQMKEGSCSRWQEIRKFSDIPF